MFREKREFQNWLSAIDWSHFITVEPTFGVQFSNDEMVQRFRTLEFKLNKHFLKSSFPKWDPFDRFFMVAFAEGDGVSKRRHFHLLLHSPRNADLQKQQFRKGSVSTFLFFEWFRISSLLSSYRKRHLEPLDVRALGTSYDNRNDSKAASIYTTKTFSNRRNFISKEFEEAHFWAFTTPSNERAFAKAVKAAA